VDTFGLSQDNFLALVANDPWLTGTPATVEQAEWFASTYEALGRPRMHLRDIHYEIVVRGLLAPDGSAYTGEKTQGRKTEADWSILCRAFSFARELGFVSPFDFIERRTRAEYEYDRDREPTDYELRPGAALLDRPKIEMPSWDVLEPELLQAPSALSRQPTAFEVWIEKESATVEREARPVAQRLGARIVVGVGFQSEVAAANLVLRAIRDGRVRLILWLADADASGESMAIATARHVEFLCRWWLPKHRPDVVVPRIFVDRVALTVEQVVEIEHEIGRTIPRSPDVAREQGRVELQALPAFAPGWVGKELERRLQEFSDPELGDAIDEWSDAAEGAIAESWEELIEPYRNRLDMLRKNRDAIAERFEPELRRLQEALDDLEPERRALKKIYDNLIETFDPELPPLPEGEVDLDVRDWLLDTERDYEEQLNNYRWYEPVHRRRPQLDLEERVCQGCDGTCECGGSLAGKKAGAKWCCGACRQRHRGRA
jgi:hypothetical protein